MKRQSTVFQSTERGLPPRISLFYGSLEERAVGSSSSESSDMSPLAILRSFRYRSLAPLRSCRIIYRSAFKLDNSVIAPMASGSQELRRAPPYRVSKQQFRILPPYRLRFLYHCRSALCEFGRFSHAPLLRVLRHTGIRAIEPIQDHL